MTYTVFSLKLQVNPEIKRMKRVYVYIFIAALMFGTMEVSLKLAGSSLDSFQLTFLRFTIGGLLLFPFALMEIKKNNTKLTVGDMLYLLLIGIVCIPVSMIFFQLGVLGSNASTAAVLFSINPLFTMGFAHFMIGERMNMRKGIALTLGVLGLVSMISPWKIQAGNTVHGMTLTLLAAVFFGLYTVLGKKSVAKMGIMAQTSLSFLLGSAVLLLIMIPMGKPILAGVTDNLAIIFYVSFFVTGLGYFFYFMAIKSSDATTGSFVFFIKPCIAPIIAVIVLDEVILWNTYLGIGLILLGSYFNIKEKRRVEALERDNHKRN